MNEEEQEIFNNLKEYMQQRIDKGYHKFIYNDLDWDFKCIDCINALNKAIELQKELDKKDKMLKEIFKYIDEHTYRDMEECEFGEAHNFICCRDCEKCIKEYFYKKVEEENE